MEQTVNLLRPKDASGVQIPLSAPMKTIEEIQMFLKNEPLLEWRLSCARTHSQILQETTGKTLFFGVGLCSDKEPSQGIPFDILMFFLEAERLKKFLSLGKVIVLIADDHALTNSFMTSQQVTTLTLRTRTLFQSIVKNLHLDLFEIRKASEMISKNKLDQELLNKTETTNQYLIHEIRDVIWMIQRDNLAIKLGWAIDGNIDPAGHDERFFDTSMREFLPHPIVSIFTKAGRTFDKHRQKVSPYISLQREHRLLLSPDEDVSFKIHEADALWNDTDWGGTRKHLGNIIRAFESLFGHMPGLSFEQKLNHIIVTSTKGVGI